MMNNDDFDSVADSTDWLSTPLSGLSAVEAALRCQICKDFYRTPMLTSCNHTFCSLCIRRALSTGGKCPLCRASEQEMKLRSNWSMEEVVAAFTQARSAVLDFARRPPPTSTREETPKRKAHDMDEDDKQQPTSPQRASKRLRSSARLSKTRSMEATAEMARQESHVPDPEPVNIEPDDGLVACPICWRRMKPIQVDRHIDTSCPGEPQPQADPTPPAQPSRRSLAKPTNITSTFTPASSTAFSPTLSNKPQPTPDRLPALNYSMLKEAQLRKELSDLSLSTSGNRGMLERRHREWVMIWNANCDSQRPRLRAELLHDLDVWERTLGSRAPTTSRSAAVGAQIRDKDFDGAAWAAKNDNLFRDLIADARRTRTQTKAKTKPNEDGRENAVNGVSASDEARGAVQPTVESDTSVLLDAAQPVIDPVNGSPVAVAIEPLEAGIETKSAPI
ncbi:DNA repair protein rad18 [Xylaria sp. FL1777]|nr:DNA repair protein rad18 [Xylaria sp. FL1777]